MTIEERQEQSAGESIGASAEGLATA